MYVYVDKLNVTVVQTGPFHMLRLTRRANVDKYTQETLAIKCRGEPGSSFDSQSPELLVSVFLSPPQTVNWTLAASRPIAQSVTIAKRRFNVASFSFDVKLLV